MPLPAPAHALLLCCPGVQDDPKQLSPAHRVDSRQAVVPAALATLTPSSTHAAFPAASAACEPAAASAASPAITSAAAASLAAATQSAATVTQPP